MTIYTAKFIHKQQTKNDSFPRSQVIGQEAFHPQDGKPYCEECWEDLFAIKCTKCSLPIKQGGVTYKLEPYHKECFTCFECDKSLAGQRQVMTSPKNRFSSFFCRVKKVNKHFFLEPFSENLNITVNKE